MSEYIDISRPVSADLQVYAGDPPVSIERVQSMAAGAICNVSAINAGAHSGTHIDAPVHFIEGAAGAEHTPLDALVGEAAVIDATGITADIDARTLDAMSIPAGVERLLFKTPNSRLWGEPGFSPHFFGIMEDAAKALVRLGVRLVGIDYLSIAPMGNPAPTHVALLSRGVVILEGLDLRTVDPGQYELICLPLLIPGSDGAPARALLRRG